MGPFGGRCGPYKGCWPLVCMRGEAIGGSGHIDKVFR